MKLIPYQTRLARQLTDLLEIQNEIKELKIFSTYYSENYSLSLLASSSAPTKEIPNDVFIPMQSIFVNIVMKYAKCFDAASDRRNIKLNNDFLKGFDEKNIETHKALMELRNKLIAHAGISFFEKSKIIEIGFNEKKEVAYRITGGHKTILGQIVESKSLEPLLKEINEKLTSKIYKLHVKLDNEMNKVSDNLLKQKILKNVPITDEDLNPA